MPRSLSVREFEDAIAAAVLAPSVLNSQPWLFRSTGLGVEVVADGTRAAVHLDPMGRELLISCGAALFNLRLALAASGRAVEVALLPDAYRPDLIGVVHVVGDTVLSAEEQRLFDAIPNRRTSRQPFDDRQVPDDVIESLHRAAAHEGARLERPPAWQRAAITRLVHDADIAQRDRPDVVDDVRSWTSGRPDEGSGIPVENLGPRARVHTSLVRDFAMSSHVPERSVADFDDESLLLVLLTDEDSAADRITAGQALERVLLEATAAGVSTALLTQPTEVAELREWLRDPGGRWGYPQSLLRLGYGEQPPPAPRRSVSEVLLTD